MSTATEPPEVEPAHSAPAARWHGIAQHMRRRLVAHLAAGGTTDFAAAPMENAAALYVDPAHAQREREWLFRRQPLLAGFSTDVAGVGDRIVFDDAGPPILIVRDRSGDLRAFLNRCSHRGSRLVDAGPDGRCQRSARITCPFHAWSFELDGRVAGVPGRCGFAGAELAKRGLREVGVREWAGLVFVQIEGDEIDLAAFLGPLASELEQLELSALQPVRAGVLHAATNWKLALDTYCENYHFAALHGTSIGSSCHANVAVFDDFAPHWRLGFAMRELDDLVGVAEQRWPAATLSAVHFLFPNSIMVAGSLANGGLWARTFRLFPGAHPGEMHCWMSVHAAASLVADASACARIFGQDDTDSAITVEDYRVAVDAYRNLVAAPDDFRLLYGRNEPALQAFHRALAERLGARP